MKYYIIAGEPSGDLHGANLMKGLLKSDPGAQFRFWGGDRMAAMGGGDNLVKHYNATSFFGIWDVVRNARTILGQIGQCKRDIEAYAPDVLILIDYPGFNMKMAEFAHRRGIRTFYYISPKVWAWKEYRVKKIKRYVDKLFIIFPFEVDYFRRWGINAIYEGNPLCDALEEQMADIAQGDDFKRENGLDDRPIVALLAGSRRNEIRNNMPFMIELSRHFPDYQFVVAGVSWLGWSVYEDILIGTDVKFVKDKTYALLANSAAAVVTSGTATLETALIGTPEFVCYRTNALTYVLGRMFIKGRFISLVNLIMEREVVRELIQGQMNMGNAVAELKAILPGGDKRERMLEDYKLLAERVGGSGASDRVAARMAEILRSEKTLKIREERSEDFDEIYRLVETAFRTAKVADGDEQDFVNTLRGRDTYIPQLALVAEHDGQLIGHIMLTRTEIVDKDGAGHTTLMLSPLSVLLEHRSQGIGAQLVSTVLEKAKEMGFRSVFLTGDPAYYSRFGFRPSAEFGIYNTNGIPDRFALAVELVPGALHGINGTISIS